MNFSSKLVENAVIQLSKLPGIGKRSALRLVLHMLRQDKKSIEKFGETFIDLINNIQYCSQCYCISENNICDICSNPNRKKEIICVVEDVRVMMAIENTMQFNGVYHVLGGLISPMDGIGPDDLKIDELIQKVELNIVHEIIFALSSTMEGDTTNYYLFKKLKSFDILLTTLSRGVTVGTELQYIDGNTLGRSLATRQEFTI